MWFKKNGSREVKEEVVQKSKNPSITFELIPGTKNINVSTFWEPHSSFDAGLFVQLIDLINSGKIYSVINKSVVVHGNHSGDNVVAESIVKKVNNPESIEDEKARIPAGMVSRYHFSQNHLHANQED